MIRLSNLASGALLRSLRRVLRLPSGHGPMDNQDEFKSRGRSPELRRQDAAALEAARRLVEAVEAPQASLLARAGELELRLGDPAVGAQHLARAAEIYTEAGLLNLALALCHRLLRLDPPPTDEYLRLGDLSAAKGYARDARLGYLEYAERRERMGDSVAARGALETYLRAFPDDLTVRRRLAELTGAPVPEVVAPAASAPPAPAEEEPDLGLLPTLVEPAPPEEPAEVDEGAMEDLLTHAAPAAESDAFQVAPLEGLESNQPEGGWDQHAPSRPEAAEDALPLLGYGPEFDSPAAEVADELARAEEVEERVEGGEEREEEEVEEDEVEEDEVEEDEVEALPLLGFESLPGRGSAPAPEAVVPEVPEASEPTPEPELPPLPPLGRPAPEYVDLGALILEDVDLPTRVRVQAEQPTGDEARDLEEILSLFREQVGQKIDPKDAASHYDLGLAFKEMGLLDDAIAHLQGALRGGAHPLATLEVLGECFIERGDPALAARILQRATQLHNAREPDLVGVLYWLGRSHELLGDLAQARAAYERVVAVDIVFRDTAARLDALRDA